MIRPEAKEQLLRWREVALAVAVLALGIWLATRPGPVMAGVGVAVVGLGGAGAVIGWRRMRFNLGESAPGVVEIVEGRISYLSPVMGGSVALSEINEVQVLVVAGARRCWRIKQVDGQALLIPLEARGAALLYDTLSALPGMSHRLLASALQADNASPRTLWRKSPEPVVELL